jgi:uncharacterized membrane protein SpoIIM required for sporulation
MGRSSVDEAAFLAKRAKDWERLRELTGRAEAGVGSLSGAELLEFVRLYRQGSADLAAMVSKTSNIEVADYLNALVARAYGQIYRAPGARLRDVAVQGVATAAQTFRRNVWAFWLSAALFFGGGFFSFAALSVRPDLKEIMVPAEMQALFDQWKKGEFDERTGGESIAMTSFYASNNPRVGVVTAAVGVATFGVLTSYIVWQNGLLLGSLSYEMNSVGKLGFLLSSVGPHGVPEIGGILVTSAAGLVLARAAIAPGRRRRGEAIRLAGKDALVLLLLGLTMIVLAAPVEGFFSFNPAVPQAVKAVAALLSLGVWALYLATYARTESEIQQA